MSAAETQALPAKHGEAPGEKDKSDDAIIMRRMDPAHHCPLHTALALTGALEGLSTLVVGSGECAAYGYRALAAHLPTNSDRPPSELHWFYALDEHDVVFGFQEGLSAALNEMADEGARVILVISTCVSHVIGEDIDGLIKELHSESSPKLFHVALPHFACDTMLDGVGKTLAVLAPKTLEAYGSRIKTPGRTGIEIELLKRIAEEASSELAALDRMPFGTESERIADASL